MGENGVVAELKVRFLSISIDDGGEDVVGGDIEDMEVGEDKLPLPGCSGADIMAMELFNLQ